LLRNTILFNSIGFPAVTIPIGLTRDNMPIGVQIIGPPFAEGKILSVAYNYEYKIASGLILYRLIPFTAKGRLEIDKWCINIVCYYLRE